MTAARAPIATFETVLARLDACSTLEAYHTELQVAYRELQQRTHELQQELDDGYAAAQPLIERFRDEYDGLRREHHRDQRELASFLNVLQHRVDHEHEVKRLRVQLRVAQEQLAEEAAWFHDQEDILRGQLAASSATEPVASADLKLELRDLRARHTLDLEKLDRAHGEIRSYVISQRDLNRTVTQLRGQVTAMEQIVADLKQQPNREAASVHRQLGLAHAECARLRVRVEATENLLINPFAISSPPSANATI